MLRSKRLPNPKLKKPLKEYYDSYYNGQFLRNVSYLYNEFNYKTYIDKKTGEEKYSVGRYVRNYSYKKKDTSRNKVLSFLTGVNNLCRYDLLLGVELGHFQSLHDYKNRFKNDNKDMLSDRLFFDFDIEDDRFENIKSGIKQAQKELKGKALYSKFDELQGEYQKLIFDEDLLKPTFEEAKALCEYLEKFGLKPYLIFSGSKGFHVNVFFEDTKLINTSDITSRLSKSYARELNLQYLDDNVSDREAKTSLQRVQYNINSKSGLYTLPIPEIYDYDDALSIIEKNKRRPIPFNFEDYIAPEGFKSMLMKMDTSISFDKLKQQKEKNAKTQARILKNKKKYKGKVNSYNDIDMRELARAYGIDGKSDGDKLIVICPFHDDHNPSGVIFKERFHCSTCNLTLNYYDFIGRLEGTNDKGKIMEKLHEMIG
ncbi:MAG: hypothetical protein IJP99_04435 [Methanobrevibacter sp.]|nr:hypothetical protein [Methanobrevibacter sp.]